MARLPAGIRKDPKTGEFICRPYDKRAGKKGRQHRFGTLSEAVAYQEKVKQGRLRPSAKQWTCDEWVAEWTSNPDYARPKESTNQHNAERVRKFAEDFAGVPLYEIDRKMARAWARKNKSRVSAVRTMFTDARQDMLIDINPFENLRLQGSAGRKHIRPMTEKEIRKLADIAYGRWPDWPVMGSMILFAAYTGLRLGELLALRWTDINFEQGTILVERQWLQKPRTYGTTKNGQSRLAPLPAPAQDALRLLERDAPAGGADNQLVWYSPRFKRIEPSLHDYYWRQVRERFLGALSAERAAEIDLDWHVLRHFTASWLVDKGVRPDDVAGALGHTDGGRLVMELYGHLYQDNSISRIQSALAA